MLDQARIDRRGLDRLFSRALDLDVAERGRFLASVSDPRLRTSLEELLRAAEITGDLLVPGGAADAGLAAAAAAQLKRPPTSRCFGMYRAVDEIGRGGMGAVYRASRGDGRGDEEVAIKVTRRGAGPHAAESFFRERRILRTLDHPNIVRLLDDGVTDQGEPYLVLELVDGVPIDRYCKLWGLTLRRRLELFARVCDAVQAAHGGGVVHRDLKPSNILVSTEGLVKLLDFGIAELLTDSLDETLSPMPLSAGAMTLQYASPEQFRGLEITTASDIYQLGLLAYELLTGARPYELAGVDPGDARRLVCEQMPTPPSRVRQGKNVSMNLNKNLDRIVLKALCKESRDRYGSADQLCADVERSLGSRQSDSTLAAITDRIHSAWVETRV